ncbi:MAG: YPDG domain-containing protein [Corynebacterium sp.]|uniref:YPDG domain-containing protein n=1 Tax=Corynebacterium sp. TaxID=1720 RepID=UPI0026DF4CEF|nr:YPDG domain-containing protein [Corynebacterium sp.]MDO5668448.1 YPDG domain-containing protein [Corynebacterium sp.]
MIFSRISATAAALALAATALTVPQAAALPTNPVSPPNGTSGSCAASASATANVPGDSPRQQTGAIPGTVTVGVQNWSNANGTFGMRPFVRAYGVAERWMTDSTLTFETDGPEGEYSVRAHTEPIPITAHTVPITHSFAPVVGEKGGFIAELGNFNANEPGWGAAATNAALWYIGGPIEEEVNGTVSIDTTVLPWPSENVNCQPLGVVPGSGPVAAVGSPQGTGAVVTAGDAADHARMYGNVYLPGTDTLVEGAEVTVNPDGTVSLSLPVGVDADAVEIQLRAKPREDEATFEAYNVDWNVGERFTVNIVDQVDGNTPGYYHAVTHPGVPITLQQNRDLDMPEGTTYEIVGDPLTDPLSDGWEYVVDASSGALTVTPPEDAQTGDYIVVSVEVTYPDGSTETIEGHVTVVDRGQPISQEEGSSVDGRCIATAGAVITPLALLAPLALASQVDIPGVSPMIRDLQVQLQRANNDLQQGLGINNPEIARLAAQINEALGPDAIRVLGAAGVAALSLLAVGVIADACLPGAGGSSGSSLSSE